MASQFWTTCTDAARGGGGPLQRWRFLVRNFQQSNACLQQLCHALHSGYEPECLEKWANYTNCLENSQKLRQSYQVIECLSKTKIF